MLEEFEQDRTPWTLRHPDRPGIRRHDPGLRRAAPRGSGDLAEYGNDRLLRSASRARIRALGESYRDGQLVGGLYGIQLGQVFFGESMFSLERDASKVALARLVDECRARDIKVIDCQVASAHLASFGAREVSRGQFVTLLRRFASRSPQGKWLAQSAEPA